MKQGNKKSSKSNWSTTVIVVAILMGLAGGLAYLVSADKGGGKKIFTAKVDLVRPDAPVKEPPQPKDKMPEPEVQKSQPIMTAPDMSQAPGPKGDNKAAADGPLGLEGEGGAGSDGFGLAGRGKGGRDVTTIGGGGGGGYDMNSVMRKHAWYNNRVQDEIDKGVRKCLNENGGIPKGKLEALVKIGMNDGGTIAEHRIIKLSGNKAMDEAIKKYFRYAKISEPLPQDMPKGEKGLAIMVIKIVSQG